MFTHSVCRDRAPRGDEDYSFNETSYIDTPAPRPLSPPSARSAGARPGSGGDAAYDNDSDGDSDQGDLGRGRAEQVHAGGSGSGAGAGGVKKAKKGTSKKSSSDGGKNYNGLEEALQLPKIAASGAPMRRK
jgi:hypothetical protein